MARAGKFRKCAYLGRAEAVMNGEHMEDLLTRAAIVVAVMVATFSSFPSLGRQQHTAPAQQLVTAASSPSGWVGKN